MPGGEHEVVVGDDLQHLQQRGERAAVTIEHRAPARGALRRRAARARSAPTPGPCRPGRSSCHLRYSPGALTVGSHTIRAPCARGDLDRGGEQYVVSDNRALIAALRFGHLLDNQIGLLSTLFGASLREPIGLNCFVSKHGFSPGDDGDPQKRVNFKLPLSPLDISAHLQEERGVVDLRAENPTISTTVLQNGV